MGTAIHCSETSVEYRDNEWLLYTLKAKNGITDS